MSNTRLMAVKCLTEMDRSTALLKSTVDRNSRHLDRRDRAFLMEIVYGVLRYRYTLDWILRKLLKKPSALSPFTLNNLRTALYQIFFMRVPDWAVVNEAVEIEKDSGRPSLVNAVLRNVLRKKDMFSFPVQDDNTAVRLSVNTSHPVWMIKRWINRFGEDDAAMLAAANNRIPPFTIRTNTLRTTRDELLQLLAANGVPADPAAFAPDGIVLKDTAPYEELSFAKGLFFVQDEASQLISHLLGPKPGERVLDACSAPGGKTTHIAQLMGDSGEIIAVEKKPLRIETLRENIINLGITCVQIINADAVEWMSAKPFDRILLDAPCSATGVIRRNPDVKYRHSALTLREFKMRQKKLLSSVSGLLRKNGVLVYSVCSTEPEEGEEVVHEFLKTAEDFRIIDAEAGFLRGFTNKGFFRTFPHKDNMDGFFGAILCRTE